MPSSVVSFRKIQLKPPKCGGGLPTTKVWSRSIFMSACAPLRQQPFRELGLGVGAIAGVVLDAGILGVGHLCSGRFQRRRELARLGHGNARIRVAVEDPD